MTYKAQNIIEHEDKTSNFNVRMCFLQKKTNERDLQVICLFHRFNEPSDTKMKGTERDKTLTIPEVFDGGGHTASGFVPLILQTSTWQLHNSKSPPGIIL